MVCLLHGHGDYDGLDPHVRKALISRFNAFVRRCLDPGARACVRRIPA